MFEFRVDEIAAAVGGQLLGGGGDVLISEVSTDSRHVNTGCLFIALVGENHDAHRFVRSALENGAAAALIQRVPETMAAGKAYILVEDTRAALGMLAHANRMRADIPLVGVTGSVGKTTAKDMIAAVLSQRWKTVKTPKNLNNDIGMPLALLNIDAETEAAVIEMGMNHLGELSYLTRLARPTAAVIVNVGDAHIENTGSREGTFKAKCEIFEGLAAGDPVISNADDVLLRRLKNMEGFRHPVTLCGAAEDADVRAVAPRQRGDYSTECTVLAGGESLNVTVSAPGEHMIYPITLAVGVGHALGLTSEEISAGLASYVPDDERMNITAAGGVTLLRDCYNANPQSMETALKTLAQCGAARRVAVLGDMYELGAIEQAAHRRVGELACELGVDSVIAVGGIARDIERGAAGCPAHHWFATVAEALPAVAEELTEGTAVLVKASHAMHFEKIAEFISDRIKMQ